MTVINSNRAVRGPVTSVPLVAGKGVKITADTVNNRFVAEVDETVLWEGACLTQGGSAATLSEAASNFEKIAVYAVPNPSSGHYIPQIFYYPGSNTAGTYQVWFGESNKGKFSIGIWQISNGTSFNLTSAAQTDSYPTPGFNAAYGGVVKVVGINRIASN